MNTTDTTISPGLGGFLAFFLIALALWLLMRSMNGKLRGIAYRGEEEGAPRRRTQHTVSGVASPETPDTPSAGAPSPDPSAEQATGDTTTESDGEDPPLPEPQDDRRPQDDRL